MPAVDHPQYRPPGRLPDQRGELNKWKKVYNLNTEPLQKTEVESKFFHQKEASKKPNSTAKVYRRGEYRTFTTAGVYLLYLFSPHIQLDSYWLGVLFKTRACDDSHQKKKRCNKSPPQWSSSPFSKTKEHSSSHCITIMKAGHIWLKMTNWLIHSSQKR